MTGKKTLGFKVTLRKSATSRNKYYVSNKTSGEDNKKVKKLSNTTQNNQEADVKPETCLCGKKFANRKSLINHKPKFKECKALYTEERQSDPTKVTCIYCGKKYKNRKNVRNHIQQVEYCKNLHEKIKRKHLAKKMKNSLRKRNLNARNVTQNLSLKTAFKCISPSSTIMYECNNNR